MPNYRVRLGKRTVEIADIIVEALDEAAVERLLDFDDNAIVWRFDDAKVWCIDIADLTPPPENASQPEKMLHHLAASFRAEHNSLPKTVKELEDWARLQRPVEA